MAGVNSNEVYLLGPDQSTTTGAVLKAAIGATAPTDARTAGIAGSRCADDATVDGDVAAARVIGAAYRGAVA